jgi:hypothetical protein
VQNVISPFYTKNVNKVHAVNTCEELKTLTIHPLALIPYAINSKVKRVNDNLIS